MPIEACREPTRAGKNTALPLFLERRDLGGGSATTTEVSLYPFEKNS